VFDAAGFPVHEALGGDNFAAEGGYDALMPKADAKGRHVWADLLQDGFADAKVVLILRVARSRGEDDAVGFKRLHLREGDLVVSVNYNFGSVFAHVLHKVVDEGVVVVDDKNFHCVLPPL
jgi:hypothetical protein